MNKLEMLSAREQLMEDVDCILESFFYDRRRMYEDYDVDKEDLTRILCDAVCKNFPSN